MPSLLPEIRQQGTLANKSWQWMFPDDGKWRDMNQDLTRKELEPVVGSEPYSDWEAFWRHGLLPWQERPVGDETDTQGFFPESKGPVWPSGVTGMARHLGPIVDFDALIETTDILPDVIKGNGASIPYMLMLSELWAEVTGYDADSGAYIPDAGWNFDRQTDAHDGRGNATREFVLGQSMEVMEDLSDIYGWEGVSDSRGYDIDWNNPNAAAQFVTQAESDVVEGKRHTELDSMADIKVVQEPGGEAPTTEEGELGGVTAGRKTIASTTIKEQAGLWASQIAGATVVPSNGEFLVTVPPGTGGWGTSTEAKEWLEDTGGDIRNYDFISGPEGQYFIRERTPAEPGTFDTEALAKQWMRTTGTVDPLTGDLVGLENFEVVPNGAGGWIVREKAPGVGGEFDTQYTANAWLTETGNADNFETYPGPQGKWLIREKAGGVFDTRADAEASVGISREDGLVKAGGPGEDFEAYPFQGKWVIREKQPELRYSTGDTYDPAGNLIAGGRPGDMFQPTITEDPTGRQIGLSASGNLLDLGYGMAGDITQEQLAGYQVPHRSLEMIVAKAIEQGNWQLARGVQAFMDRPSERDLLDYARQYAESPADLAVLSAIARGEQIVQPAAPLQEGMGTGMGQATRIGPPGEVYTRAYQQFIDTMNEGYVPNEDEMRELFDPKNDPAYIATQELANKYETQIGTLRNEIAEANKTASERIESTQTNTLNLMTGLFKDTLDSFKDVMKQNTAMSKRERDSLVEQSNINRRIGVVPTSVESGATDATDAADDMGAKIPLSHVAAEESQEGLVQEGLVQEGKVQEGKVQEGKVGDGGIEGGEVGTTTTTAQPFGSSAALAQLPGFRREDYGEMTPIQQMDVGLSRTPQMTALPSAPAPAPTGVQQMDVALSPNPQRMPITPVPPVPPDVRWDQEWGSQLSGGVGLAEGGVVQGPTMALLGEEEPEFIVPLSKVNAFKRGRLPLGQPRQAQTGGTVAKFEDSIPRFANGGLVIPSDSRSLFGGVMAGANVANDANAAQTLPLTPRSGADLQNLLKPGISGTGWPLPAQHPIGIQQLMAGRPMARPRSLMTAANMPIPSGQALRNMLPSEIAYYQKMGAMAGIPQEELGREMRSAMPGGTRRTPLRMGARRVRQA